MAARRNCWICPGLAVQTGRVIQAVRAVPASGQVAARADADVLGQPERLLEYLVDHMLAGLAQDDDVTVLVIHRPAEGAR